MTTVVCNKKEMACDLQFTSADWFKWKGKTKIYKFPAHENSYQQSDFIVGFAGAASEIIDVADWFFNPVTKVPVYKNCSGLVLTKSGDIYQFHNPTLWMKVDSAYHAIGSGGVIAIGALAQGATPKEAVKIASKYDVYTGMGVKSLCWT